MWPSDRFALMIEDRLNSAGKRCHVVRHPNAGHRMILPGEPEAAEPVEHAWGGSVEADREIGRAAWVKLGELMGFKAQA